MTEHDSPNDEEGSKRKTRRKRGPRPSLNDEVPPIRKLSPEQLSLKTKEDRLRNMRVELGDLTVTHGQDQHSPEVVELLRRMRELQEEIVLEKGIRRLYDHSESLSEYQLLNQQGSEILTAIDAAQDGRVTILPSPEQIPIVTSNELQFTGGHLVPIVALLQNTSESQLLNDMKLFKVTEYQSEPAETYSGYLPMDDVIAALSRHEESSLRYQVGYMVQQELSNIDVIQQLHMMDVSEAELAQAQSEANDAKIIEVTKQMNITKSRIARSQALARNTRMFLTRLKGENIDLNEVLAPVMVHGEAAPLSFTDNLLKLCERNLFEGTNADPKNKARVDAISSELYSKSEDTSV